MEQIRNFEVKIVIDTNKQTIEKNFTDDTVNATEFLFAKLSDEERLLAMSKCCKYCGTMDLPCHCMNDE